MPASFCGRSRTGRGKTMYLFIINTIPQTQGECKYCSCGATFAHACKFRQALPKTAQKQTLPARKTLTCGREMVKCTVLWKAYRLPANGRRTALSGKEKWG